MGKKTGGGLVKRGKTWHAVWMRDGKRFSRSTKTQLKREAEKVLASIMAPFGAQDEIETLANIAGKIQGKRAELERYEAEQNPPLPLDKGWIRYADATNRPDSGGATLQGYEGQFKAFTTWAAQRKPPLHTFQDVSEDVAGEYAEHLIKRGLTPNSFNKHISLLELVFRVLAKPARVTTNPWSDIGRRRQVSTSRRELTISELKTVYEAAMGEMRLLFAIGIYTGLRLGDAATLRWAEADIARRIIRRIPNKTGRRNPKPVLVPIHAVLAGMLVEAAESIHGEFVLPQYAEMYQTDKTALSRMVQKHFQSCGIRTVKQGTGAGLKTGKRAVVEVGFHSLRHTFVSLCRESDVPLAVVESIVGHSNPAMTRHYTHTGELAAAAAVNGLPSVLHDETLALPGPGRDSWRTRVRDLANRLTADNIEEVKTALLSLADDEGRG